MFEKSSREYASLFIEVACDVLRTLSMSLTLVVSPLCAMFVVLKGFGPSGVICSWVAGVGDGGRFV